MARTALTALMVRRQMAQTVVQLAVTAALAAPVAMADRLMAAAGLVPLAAARRPEEMAATGEMAATVATAAAQTFKSRSAAMAALPVISQPVALAATLLADRAATVATAATVGRLMAAARLVAMARLVAAAAR